MYLLSGQLVLGCSIIMKEPLWHDPAHYVEGVVSGMYKH